jgi:hypothetical protein
LNERQHVGKVKSNTYNTKREIKMLPTPTATWAVALRFENSEFDMKIVLLQRVTTQERTKIFITDLAGRASDHGAILDPWNSERPGFEFAK